ncbi:MAG: hypothetical protein ACI9CF_000753 [Candidatus Omnitrophota bacterium]|jgi:hypothetical protein
MSKSTWGVMTRFDTPEDLLAACEKVRDAGYKKIDAYAPFPIHGLTEALGKPKTKIQWLILAGGIFGGFGGFFMQWYANVVSWPWNVGGRPLNSWPSFMPVTFELTILCAALVAVIGMFALCGFPEPYHPVFNLDEFEGASKDKFFVCIMSKDSKFDIAKTKQFMESLKGDGVFEVQP